MHTPGILHHSRARLGFSMLLLAISAMCVSAQTMLRVVKTDGTESLVRLHDGLTATIDSGTLHISGKDTTTDIAMADVSRLDYTKYTSTSINVISAANLELHTDGRIEITGAPSSSTIKVVTLSGNIAAKIDTDSNGHAVISTAGWPSGIYIVTIDSTLSLKVAIK